MNHLYTTFSGHRVEAFSYTQASAIQQCGHQFDLQRLRGWDSKLEDASLKFGICVESAVRAIWEHKDAQETFKALWEGYKGIALNYTSSDESWENLAGVGKALMKEFTTGRNPANKRLWFEHLCQPLFSQRLEKRDWYAGTTLEYIVDALCTEPSGQRIVDMKTSSKSYPEDPLCTMMDNQLRTGCLVTGVRKVAFLTFVKTSRPKIQWLEADVPDGLVADVDIWLREQRDKVVAKKFHRNWGFRFPEQHCMMCRVKSVCLGDMERARLEGLYQKVGKDQSDLEFLDSI